MKTDNRQKNRKKYKIKLLFIAFLGDDASFQRNMVINNFFYNHIINKLIHLVVDYVLGSPHSFEFCVLLLSLCWCTKPNTFIAEILAMLRSTCLYNEGEHNRPIQ